MTVFSCLIRRLEGPIALADDVEADVARTAAAAAVLRAVPAVPDGDFRLCLAFGAFVRRFRVNAIRAKHAGDLAFTHRVLRLPRPTCGASANTPLYLASYSLTSSCISFTASAKQP